MCGDNETDPTCSSFNTKCCFYHGKLASKLVLEKIIDKPIFQSGGEFVLNPKFPHKIISVANQSGHFHPPDFSNTNFTTELSKKINNDLIIKILNWETGDRELNYTIVKPQPQQRGGDKYQKIRRKNNKPFKRLFKKLIKKLN